LAAKSGAAAVSNPKSTVKTAASWVSDLLLCMVSPLRINL
jgi:hypothetical protein